LLAARRAAKVLSVCVEVCSAAFFLDDDPGVLVSACLFGDGAGAAILTSERPENKRSAEWKQGFSMHSPQQRELLRFDHKGGKLRNRLSPLVPEFAGEEVGNLFAASLADAGVRQEQITGWILHTGGRDVILAVREKLNLSEMDVRHSSAVLREFGNISSPTVFFVLERALRDSVPDGLWWMSSFGAGFSCHGALLEVR
jgi:alkylresorcinol/alkylpyrone synthase